MKSLLEQLTEQTQDLKKQYVSQCETWAINNFSRLQERLTWKDADWCKLMGITPEERKNFKNEVYYTFPSGFYNTRNARTLDNLKSEVRRITGWGLEEYLKRERKDAELHYTQSVEKLVFRLNKKGVTDETPIVIKRARVGINLEIAIEHEGKITRAFTIFAEGEIQRPHYRYLVK